MRIVSFCLLAICLAINSVCGQIKNDKKAKSSKSAEKLSVRYIGNEGVLIASGDRQILIDGLHREYKPFALFPPPDLLKSLETAEKPYDEIDILLVSHIHLDHFHSESVGLHLKNNPKSLLFSSEEIVGEVKKNFADYEKIKPQIKSVSHEWKKSFEIDQNGIKVKFLGLKHGGERAKNIQNFGHLIEIGGKKLLHIGDADMTAENFSAFELAKEKIDIAFIPYWFLLSENGRKLVQEQFAPKHIIAVHIPPLEAENEAKNFKTFYPNDTAFTKILEEKVF